MNKKDLFKIIDDAKNEIRNSDTLEKIFNEYNIDSDELDLIPICFSDDIDVSARTDHGIIYLSTKLLDSIEEIPHYLIHEITHYAQQTTGDKPTKGSGYGNYLDNKEEVEGFKNQVEYIADENGEREAEDYIDKVLDHHDIEGKEREEKKNNLLDRRSTLQHLYNIYG